MKSTLFAACFLILAATCFAASVLDLPIHDVEFIAKHNNNPKASWKATVYPQFANLTMRHASKFLGTFHGHSARTVPKISNPKLKRAGAPDSFDSRTKWANCIHPIRNQEQCGSCWAFSASEVLSDRLCIASQGKINYVLSPEYMVECDSTGMYNCMLMILTSTIYRQC